jgi:hypothetical protein
MSERYQFDSKDRALLDAAVALLKKVIADDAVRPAELVSVAKLLHVFTVLPKVTPGLEVTVSVISPRRNFDEIETFHWWDVGVEGERLSIISGGHFYRPSTGGDTFRTIDWAAVPGEPAESEDHRASLQIVPDVQSFSDGVASIDFASGNYTVEVTDGDNPLLEDDGESNDEHSNEVADSDQARPEGDADEEVQESSEVWSVTAIDATEMLVASVIDPDEVDANAPAYAYGVADCGLCQYPLDGRGIFVDGWLRDERITTNMCAACFASKGKGIGWGIGQLNAMQSNGRWRRVAGFRGGKSDYL